MEEQMIKNKLNSEKGITIISLIIIIIILLILSGVIIKNVDNSSKVAGYNNMIADISLLEDKLLVYFNKYGEIPKTTRSININAKDYYEIDLLKLDNITLNYGQKYGKTDELVIDKSDVYVVNDALEVYYVQGINLYGERYYCINQSGDIVQYQKPEIEMISGEKNPEGVYTTEVSIEIVPVKDDLSGVNETTYVCYFTDKDGKTEQILNENITENKIIKLDKNGTYVFVVTSVDKNGNETTTEKTININIQKEFFKLTDVITADNYGDVIEYEANGVKDWKVFFNDGDNVFIITSKVIPYTSLPKNSKMRNENMYRIGWEPIYGAPAPGFEYGHAPIVADITENSKILERAQKFKCGWIQENIDNEDAEEIEGIDNKKLLKELQSINIDNIKGKMQEKLINDKDNCYKLELSIYEKRRQEILERFRNLRKKNI